MLRLSHIVVLTLIILNMILCILTENILRVEEESPEGTRVGELVFSTERCATLSKTENLFIVDNNLFRVDNFTLYVNNRFDGDAFCLEDMCRLSVKIGSERHPICEVHVEIVDKDDNDPVFDASFGPLLISERTEIGRTWPLPVVKDADFSAKANDVNYTLIRSSGDGADVFGLHYISSTLFLQLNSNLDYERDRDYYYTLYARDTHGKFDNLPIHIRVTDVNDNSPQFDTNVIQISVNESHPVLAKHNRHLPIPPIITVNARDADSGRNGQIEYELRMKQRNLQNYFFINTSTGAIFLLHRLNTKNVKHFEVEVVAEDLGMPSLTNSCLVNIHVIDENDHPPRISLQDKFSEKLFENQPAGTPVGVISVTDDDTDSNGNIVCELIGNSTRDFVFVSLTGINSAGTVFYDVTTLRSFDREMESQVTLMISCTDNGRPWPHQSYKNITIHILDENEFPPKLLTHHISTSLYEDVRPGTVIEWNATVRDNDATRNHTFQISDSDSVAQLYFMLDSITGVLQTRSSLDREQNNLFRFGIHVYDHGHPTHTVTVTVFLEILDVNDNPPKFLSSTEQYVMENSHNSTILLLAQDPDIEENSRLHWQIKENSNSHLFFIPDPSVGVIRISEPLDRELQSTYTLHLLISDHGKPDARTSTGTVTLHVLDENDNVPQWTHPQPSNITFLNFSAPLMAFSPIAVLQATDKDEGENAQVNYHLAEESETFFYLKVDNYATVYSRGILQEGIFPITVFAIDGSARSSIRHTSSTTIMLLITPSTSSTVTSAYFGLSLTWSLGILIILMLSFLILLVLWFRSRSYSSCFRKEKRKSSFTTLNNKCIDIHERSHYPQLHATTKENLFYSRDPLPDCSKFDSPLSFSKPPNFFHQTSMVTSNGDSSGQHLSESNLLISPTLMSPYKFSCSQTSNSDLLDNPYHTWTMLRPCRCTVSHDEDSSGLNEKLPKDGNDMCRMRSESGFHEYLPSGLIDCFHSDTLNPNSSLTLDHINSSMFCKFQCDQKSNFNKPPLLDKCGSVALMTPFLHYHPNHPSVSPEMDITLV